MPSHEQLRALAQARREQVIDLCQRLVRTPSLPSHEGELAQLIQAEMERLGYDRAWRDEAGNVIGLMRGTAGPKVQFNTHMDHVDPGNPADWPFPPYEARLHEGYIWGRGASDIKGPMAAQIVALAALREAGIPLRADCYVACVVNEEQGGLGTRHLTQTLPCDYAVIGEASSNQLVRGHRGRAAVVARFRGRSVHASMPEKGVNPHYSAARFISALRDLPMARDPDLGPSSVTPTLYLTDQTSFNVVPGEVVVHLDWRFVPGEDEEAILGKLRPVLRASLVDGCQGEVDIPEETLATYTGYTETRPLIAYPMVTRADAPAVQAAQRALEEVLQRPLPPRFWRFTTDGGHLARAGVTCIGFGPGDETVVHTVQERIATEELVEAVAGYMALALALGDL
ncbi:MAG: M20/M25/M40 family metallo-hydrolase [Anaerolineae bacterium]|nr:M20/M25/M40 family metallo-hydrolase [Anaerolineae bacterium]